MQYYQVITKFWIALGKVIKRLNKFDVNSKTSVIFLIIWVVVLLVANNGQQSFMAHDEGYYFLQGRWIVESGDWLTVRWWQQPEYDRTIGLQWVIAFFYQMLSVLGNLAPNFVSNFNEQITRLPSLISSILASILIYQIAKYWLRHTTAIIAGALLILSHLWLQYSRMGTQDILLVTIELLLIFSLLKATNLDYFNSVNREYDDDSNLEVRSISTSQEANLLTNKSINQSQNLWLLLAGNCIGIGFLIKSVMILLPCLALLPFVIYTGFKKSSIHRKHYLYLGLILGFLPFIIWLGLSTQKYGAVPLEQLFGKLLILGKKAYHNDANIFYYFWNIPVNSLPWSLLALWQLVKYCNALFRDISSFWLNDHTKNQSVSYWQKTWQKIISWCDSKLDAYHLLIWFYPLILWAELTIFSTRTAYYALQIYPWLAIWAALGIEDIVNQVNCGQKAIFGRMFTYFLGFIGFVAIILSGLISLNLIKTEGLLLSINPGLAVLGIGWLSLIYFWHQEANKNKRGENWQATLLLSTWLGLATVGFTGVLGNYSSDLKLGLQKLASDKMEVATILKQQQIHFIAPKEVDGEEHKTWVLLGCYTPKLGRYLSDLNLLDSRGYAWVYPSLVKTAETNGFENLATLKGWALMHKKSTR